MNDSDHNPQLSLLLVANPDDYAALVALLRQEKDYSLQRTASFEDGLNAALANEYSIIFVAEQLATRSGLDFLHEAQERDCKTPLILLARSDDAPLQREAMRAGATDVLIEAEISRSLLKRILRFAGGRREDALRLKDAASRLQSTLETAMDGILIVDSSGHIVNFNHKFAEMWRVPAAIMESRDNLAPRAFVLDQLSDPDAFMARVHELHAQPEISSVDILAFKDGRVFERYSRSQFADGEFRGRVSSFRDVSEQARATQALLHSEARNATILQSALDCIISMDGQGRIVEWNPAAERTFGFTRAQAVGQLMGDLIVPVGLREDHYKGLKRYLETGRDAILGRRVELPARHADGSELMVELSVVRIPVEGEPLFTGYLRDITERKRAEAALQESQARYERMVANAPGMVYQFALRPDGTQELLSVSEGCRAIYGIEPQQALEDVTILFSTIHPDDAGMVEASIKASARTLEPWNCEWRLTDAAGQAKCVQGAARPERQADGSIVWDGVLMDITERKTAEDALRERAKYEALTAALSTFFIDLPSEEVDAGISNALGALGEFEEVERTCVFLWDDDRREMSGTHEWCAPGIKSHIERLQNLPADSLPWLSQQLLALETIHIPRVADLPPEAQAEREVFTAAGMESMVIVPMVYRNRLIGHLSFNSVGREKAWSLNSIALLRIAGEMFVNALERKRSDLELRGSEARNRALLNAIPDLMMRVRRDGTILDLRPSKDFEGLLPHDCIGRNLSDLFEERLMQPMMRRLEQALQSLEVQPLEYQVNADGEISYFEARITASGEDEVTCIVRDVSQRRRTEEEILRLNETLELRVQARTAELAQANDALRGAKEEAEAANLAKSEFLGRMSHELRTPLNAILGFGQLLEMRAQEPKQQANVGQILKAGHHLLSLINEVLDIARIESGHLSVSIEPVSLEHVVSESIELIAPLAQQRSIALKRDPDSMGESYVMADRQRLVQVLLNLLSNAVKYNHEGGNVRFHCSHTSEGRVGLSIRDSGAGLEADKLARLFVPFDRLGAESSGIEGTGLGLALSKRLVEAMGGTLSVHSVPGQGCDFQVELPAAEAPAQKRGFVEAARSVGDSMIVGTVLVIEDNLANVMLLEQIMEGRDGIRLLPAMQGGVGLELARRHQPDLILLDLHLPDLPGQEVLRRLNSDPLTRHIPVIVVSADATPSQVTALLNDGARAYLTKPLDVREFLEVLEENLQLPA